MPIRDAITNWQVPLPWHTKLRLAIRNVAIKLVNRQSCCGHPGEPGC
jgi:hypothetical protein